MAPGGNSFPDRGTLLTNHYAIKLSSPETPTTDSRGKSRASPGPASQTSPLTTGTFKLYRYVVDAVRVQDNSDAGDKSPPAGGKNAKGNASPSPHMAPKSTAAVQMPAMSYSKATAGGKRSPTTITKPALPVVPMAKQARNQNTSASPKAPSTKSPTQANTAPTSEPEDKDPPGSKGLNDLKPQNRRRLMYLFLQNLKDKPGMEGRTVATDYSTLLVTSEPLPANILNYPHSIILYGDHEARAGTKPRFEFTFTQSEVLQPSELQSYLKGNNDGNDNSQTAEDERKRIIQTLNIVFAHVANQKTFQDTPRHLDKSVARIGGKKFFAISHQGTDNQIGPWGLAEFDGSLQARKGFYLSTRTTKGPNGQLLLNVNTTTSAFYFNGGTLQDYHDFYDNVQSGILMPQVNKLLKGLRLRTNYVTNNRGPDTNERSHTLVGFLLQGDHVMRAGQKTFMSKAAPDAPERETSVAQYFQMHYPSASVVHSDMIAEVVGPKGTSIFVPAKCLDVMKGQFYAHKTEMASQATRTPQENRSLIEHQGVELLGLHRKQVAGFGGLAIESGMLRVQAKVVMSPAVTYRPQAGPDGNGNIGTKKLREGKWDIMRTAFTIGARASDGRWTYLEIATGLRTSATLLHAFYERLGNQLRDRGTSCGSWESTRHTDRGPETNTNLHQLRLDQRGYGSVRNALLTRIGDMTRTFNTANNKPVDDRAFKLMFVLLPEKDIPLYAMIKSFCEQELGIQTVCHVCKKAPKPKPGQGYKRPQDSLARRQPYEYGPTEDLKTIGNMAMKFNLKMATDTVNQRLGTTNIPLLAGADTMLMGIDVTHAGLSALKGAPSVAAVVGSVNQDYSQFPAVLRSNPREETSDTASDGKSNDKFQPQKGNEAKKKEVPKPGRPQERVKYLKDMVKESISKWGAAQGKTVPNRLIVFRDGLSEEQLDMCRRDEIEQIRQAISEIDPTAPTQLLVLCTVKRHHVRFFPDDGHHQQKLFPNKLVNPRPGTVIDNGVTIDDNNEQGDFFLISHDVLSNRGTARPTHYIILVNDMQKQFKRDDVITMTHALCYNFGRSTTSVSLATPSYYADLAADRARCYVRNVYAPDDPDATYDAASPAHAMNLTLDPHVRDTMFYI